MSSLEDAVARNAAFLVAGPVFAPLAGAVFAWGPFRPRTLPAGFDGEVQTYRRATFFTFALVATLHFTFSPLLIDLAMGVLASFGLPYPLTFFLAAAPVLFAVLLIGYWIGSRLPGIGRSIAAYLAVHRVPKWIMP